MKKGILLIGFCFFGLVLFGQQAKLIVPIGHTDKINNVSFSPDGRRFVTAADDHTAKIWDAKTGMVLAELNGHTRRLTDASFSPDNKKTLTVSEDNTVKIWDAQTGRLLLNLKDIEGGVSSASFSTDSKKIETHSKDLGSNNFLYTTWSAQTGTILAKPREISLGSKRHKRKDYTQFSSPDGKTILSFQYPSDLYGMVNAQLSNAKTGKLINAEVGSVKEAYGAGFSPDGKRIMVVSSNGSRICDGHTGAVLVELKGNTSFAKFSFSPDGKKVVTANRDSTVTIWDTQTGALLNKIIVSEIFFYEVSYSRDGREILTNGSQQDAKVLDAQTGALLVDFGKNIGDDYNNYSFSHDSKRIFASNDKNVKIWGARNGTLLINLKRDTSDDSWDVSFSPDERKIIALGNNTAEIWDAQTGVLLIDLKKHSKKLKSAFFSADEKKIIVRVDDSVEIWDGQKFTLTAGDQTNYNFVIDSSKFTSASFSPDGKRIVTVSKFSCDTSINIRIPQSGTLLTSLKGDSGIVKNASFSPDGKEIISLSWYNVDKIQEGSSQYVTMLHRGMKRVFIVPPPPLLLPIDTGKSSLQSQPPQPAAPTFFYTVLNLWDAQTGTRLASFKGDTTRLRNALLSPDNKKILTVSMDDTVNILDAQTGALRVRLKGHICGINDAVFSPDSKKIITSCVDNTASLWDAETGALLTILKGHSGNVKSAVFSPDGKNILTSSEDNTCKIWNAKTGRLRFTFLVIDDTDYLVTDPYGHFDGSEGARKLLYFTCGTDFINSENVKKRLWVPDLAEHIIKGDIIKAKKLADLYICRLKHKDK